MVRDQREVDGLSPDPTSVKFTDGVFTTRGCSQSDGSFVEPRWRQKGALLEGRWVLGGHDFVSRNRVTRSQDQNYEMGRLGVRVVSGRVKESLPE